MVHYRYVGDAVDGIGEEHHQHDDKSFDNNQKKQDRTVFGESDELAMPTWPVTLDSSSWSVITSKFIDVL